MDPFGNVYSLPLGQVLANMFATYFDPALITGMVTGLSNLLGGPVGTVNDPGADDSPPFLFAQRNGDAILLISGTRTYTQAVRTVQGYLNDSPTARVSPSQSYFELLASRIDAAIFQAHFPLVTRILIAGHSIGGAIGMQYAVNLEGALRRPQIKLITFGAPKFSNTRNAEILNNVHHARWMMADDPIPVIMPTFVDNPAMLLLFDIRALSRFANFVHPQGGMQITSTFAMSPAVLPSNASTRFTGALASWIWNAESATNSPHSPATYSTRLGTWEQQNPLPRQQPTRGGGREAVAHVPRGEATQAAQGLVTAIAEQAAQQNQGPLVIPQRLRVGTFRSSGVTVVHFGGQAIAYAANKRSGKAFAAHTNEFLDRLQRQAAVDPAGLVAALQAYLAQASDPAGGFAPLMRQSLPT